MSEDKLNKVSASIRNHCTALAATYPDHIDGYAHSIIVYHDNCHAAVGHSHDLKKIKKIKAAISKCEEILVDDGSWPSKHLSNETLERLNYLLPKTPHELREWPTHPKVSPFTDIDGKAKFKAEFIAEPSLTKDLGMIKDRIAALQSLRTGLDALEEAKEFQTQATGKRYYSAAVVFYACRKVWQEEINVNSPPCRDPENCSGYNECKKVPACGNQAPWELHNDFDSPFKLFVEAVFDDLTVGGTVQAATKSLKQLNESGYLPLSITVG